MGSFSMSFGLVSVSIGWALGLVSIIRLHASDQIPGAPQDRPIAIIHATVHPVSGPTLTNATVLFEEGKIVAVGRRVVLPEGCRVIEGAGRHVYPSLIEPYSDIGLVEINSVRGTLDQRETGEINAAVRAVVAFNPDSELIPVCRANGILLAVTAPRGGVLAGRSALMMLDGWTWEEMMLQPDVGMHGQWSSRPERIAALQKTVDAARRYGDLQQSASPTPRDLNLDAMQAVLTGQVPLVLAATDYEEITGAVAFAVNNGLRLIILGGYDAPMCADLLKKHEVPVIVTGVYRLPQRRHASYDEAYALPARLHQAGIHFCIASSGRFGASMMRNLPYHAGTAVGFGLPPELALRSITLSTAEILGVADRVGSLEPGKDATLFVASGDILETPSNVELAFVQGRQVDLTSKHTDLYHKYEVKYKQLRQQPSGAR